MRLVAPLIISAKPIDASFVRVNIRIITYSVKKLLIYAPRTNRGDRCDHAYFHELEIDSCSLWTSRQ